MLLGGYRLFKFWFVEIIANRHAITVMIGAILITLDRVTHEISIDFDID